jgi:hypothetical protein
MNKTRVRTYLIRLQSKMNEFKAKTESNSTAIAQVFNAEIVYFECGIANYGLFSASLRLGMKRRLLTAAGMSLCVIYSLEA